MSSAGPQAGTPPGWRGAVLSDWVRRFDRLVERAVLRSLDSWEEGWLRLGMLVSMALCWAGSFSWPGTAEALLFLQLAMLTFFFGLRAGLLWIVPTWFGYAACASGVVERVCFALFCIYGLLIAGVTVAKFRQALRGQLQMSSALEMARQVQISLQPPPLLDWGYATMASLTVTALQLGGDLVCWQPGRNGVLVLVGDVMGKGAQAALTAAYVKGLFDEVAQSTTEPDDILLQVHRHLLQRTSVDSFLCAICIHLDVSHDVWRISRAGLPSPVIMRASGQSVYSPEAGIMLGIPLDPGLRVTEVPHEPGDRLFLASDGLCEEEELPECLIESLRKLPQQDPSQALQTCVETLLVRGTGEKLDDQTAVLISWA